MQEENKDFLAYNQNLVKSLEVEILKDLLIFLFKKLLIRTELLKKKMN
jgi:hypothetical protein